MCVYVLIHVLWGCSWVIFCDGSIRSVRMLILGQGLWLDHKHMPLLHIFGILGKIVTHTLKQKFLQS